MQHLTLCTGSARVSRVRLHYPHPAGAASHPLQTKVPALRGVSQEDPSGRAGPEREVRWMRGWASWAQPLLHKPSSTSSACTFEVLGCPPSRWGSQTCTCSSCGTTRPGLPVTGRVSHIISRSPGASSRGSRGSLRWPALWASLRAGPAPPREAAWTPGCRGRSCPPSGPAGALASPGKPGPCCFRASSPPAARARRTV